jgi:hypothetical protein
MDRQGAIPLVKCTKIIFVLVQICYLGATSQTAGYTSKQRRDVADWQLLEPSYFSSDKISESDGNLQSPKTKSSNVISVNGNWLP